MYRISSSMIHTMAGSLIQKQSGDLTKMYAQIASGKKVTQPADDPVAAVKILDLQSQQADFEQYAKNISSAINRSNLEENALADSATSLQHARELLVQGGNLGSLSASDRQSIANALQSELDQLQDIANRKDSNGEYLFSGFSTAIQPFVRNGAGVMQYQGDDGSRLVQVGASQRLADGYAGRDVFFNVPQGNGTFYTGTAAANTGAGVIDVGSVTSQAAWVPANYTLTFTSATTWQVTNNAAPATPITTGTYTAGSAINFNGVQVKVSGTPASGDTFAINRSQTQDVFKTLDDLITALKIPSTAAAANAQIATAVGTGLQQLDQTLDHLSGIRSQVGTRLNALDAAESSRQTSSDELTKSLSQLQDLDYSTALTKYSAQQVALQAAQQSYSQIARLSLFNYL